MENNNLTPEESFSIITKAISNFKINYKENSKSFLLWGWVMSLASFSHFTILKILISKEAYDQMLLFSIGTWTVFVFVGFIIEFFSYKKSIKAKKVFSHLDRYINYLWKVTGFSIPILIFISIRLEIPPPPIFLLILGTATTITGLFIKFKPVTIGGIAFFLFAIISTFVTGEN
ncbi:MAG: hypothetical protein PVF73_11215, partial [Bacteroidales bacterium]